MTRMTGCLAEETVDDRVASYDESQLLNEGQALPASLAHGIFHRSLLELQQGKSVRSKDDPSLGQVS